MMHKYGELFNRGWTFKYRDLIKDTEMMVTRPQPSVKYIKRLQLYSGFNLSLPNSKTGGNQ
jgi:hypothetical protein